jgi:hypothetical protein
MYFFVVLLIEHGLPVIAGFVVGKNFALYLLIVAREIFGSCFWILEYGVFVDNSDLRVSYLSLVIERIMMLIFL